MADPSVVLFWGTDPFLLRRVEVLEKDLGWRLRLKLATGFNLA